MEKGYSGQAGQTMPELTDEFVDMVSARYIELYEEMTGEKFAKADSADVMGHIEMNVKNYLKEQAA
jgi:phosphoribosylaminoimidazole-succinocarboxamide synthase